MVDVSGFGIAAAEFKRQFDSGYGDVNPESQVEVGAYLNLLTASFNQYLMGNPVAVTKGHELAETVQARERLVTDTVSR